MQVKYLSRRPHRRGRGRLRRAPEARATASSSPAARSSSCAPQEMTAYVRRADGKKAFVIRLGRRQDAALERARRLRCSRCSPTPRRATSSSPRCEAARPMLETQMQLSRIPTPKTLLIERLESREGQHLFLYPFAGRNAHIGLGSLLAWRLVEGRSRTPSDRRSTTTASSCSQRQAGRPDAAASTRACSTTATCCTTCSPA